MLAYASIAASNPNHESDLDLLRRWCCRIPVETEILAEEVHPSEHHRPLWNQVLAQIEQGTLTMLIVPSLFHIAGEDYIALSKALIFLRAHGVTIKSISEIIDSRRDSNHEIIMRLVQDTGKVDAVRGAQ